MTDDLASCERCGAILTAWEKRCSCDGPRKSANAELLYATACDAKGSMHVRDFVRLVERDYGRVLTEPTANAALAPDPRFCWAGRGLYCLYRHGPLPGPRNLEAAARLILFAAGHPLTIDALDFTLKRLGYRYNVASLSNAINKSLRISWRRSDGRWDHLRGDAAERDLRAAVRAVPPRRRAAWQAMINRLGQQIQTTLADRQTRLRVFGNSARFGIDWSADVSAGL